MPRLFRARRSKGRLAFDPKKLIKHARPQVDQLFNLALADWLLTFAMNVPVWQGRARTALVFAKGNIRGTISNYAGLPTPAVPIVETYPNVDTLSKDAIAQGKKDSTVRINRPKNNKPESFSYEVSFSTNTPQLLMSRNWPKGARDTVEASGPKEAAAMAADRFAATFEPRILKRILIDAFRKSQNG